MLSIDRRALVTRHNPVYHGAVHSAPLSVGNGKFCFTACWTGLQTFNHEAEATTTEFPLCTMAEWAWHSYADAPSAEAERALKLEPFDTWGREVGYAVRDAGQEALFKNLRQNAHKFNLGKLSFSRSNNRRLPKRQTLSLWEGVLYSEWVDGNVPVNVETFAAPSSDTIYVRAAPEGRLEDGLCAALSFPYGSHKKAGGVFNCPHLHKTSVVVEEHRRLVLCRIMDKTVYTVIITLEEGNSVRLAGEHEAVIIAKSGQLVFSVRFVEGEAADILQSEVKNFSDAKTECAAFWEKFWAEGGAIDLGGSTDARAAELERRIVLSQYLCAIQSRGSLVPAETGLTMNSWYGKFHLEMHYWHTGWFALWGKIGDFKRSLSIYRRFLPEARKIAASQGYKGARWQKMCDYSGRVTPSSIAVLLVWQQPHPIFLAEMAYRASPSPEFLREYRDIVEETAVFMLDFLHKDESGTYVLGPPLIPAQERHDPRIVLNPAFETAYFRWAFCAANLWRRRQGEAPRADFEEAALRLAQPAVHEGVYIAHERCPETFSQAPFNTDHPSMLMMKGVLPGECIDDAIMNATLDRVLRDWDMQSLWGWDFPVLAMTACRLGRSEDALRLLLLDSPKNTYLPNGHNCQSGEPALPVYLPGNGGTLLAAAMFTAGYDGSTPLPGFPKNGKWNVRFENISPSI